MAEYVPTRPQALTGVEPARVQANNVDVAASAQDVDSQIASARSMQEATRKEASTKIDLNAEVARLNSESAQAANDIKMQNDGIAAAVDPNLKKINTEAVQGILRMQELRKESQAAGFNIFKQMAIQTEGAKVHKELVADTQTYNQLMEQKNASTQMVNNQLQELQTSYLAQQKALALQADSKLQAASAQFKVAEIESKTSSYVAKTEMGVAQNVYERNRQGVADARADAQLNLDKSAQRIREKELAAREGELDAQANDLVIQHQLAITDLPNTPQNRRLMEQKFTVADARDKASMIGNAQKWAVVADPTDDLDTRHTKAIAGTVMSGTVGDFRVLSQNIGTGKLGMTAFVPTVDTVQEEQVKAEAAYAAQKPLDPLTGLPAKLTTDERVAIRRNIVEGLEARTPLEQRKINEDLASQRIQQTFNSQPAAPFASDVLLPKIVALQDDEEFTAGLSANQIKALKSVDTQLVLKGQVKTLGTNNSELVLSTAQQLIASYTMDTGGSPILNKNEAASLVSRLLTRAATDYAATNDPNFGTLLQDLEATKGMADSAGVRISLNIPAVRATGLQSYFNPETNKYADLGGTDLADPVSLLRGLEARQRAITEQSKNLTGKVETR